MAISLLWATSLSAIMNLLGVTNAIPIPKIELVIHESIRLYNESNRLRTDYINCVSTELEVCNATLVYRMQKEATRSEEARRRNVEARNSAQTTQGACATAHAKALASMSAWIKREGATSNATIQGMHYKSECTAEERETLEAQSGDTNAQKSATYQLATGYSRDSQSTVGRLADQLDERSSYDQAYLYNKTLRDAELNVTLSGIALDLSTNISARFDGLNLSVVKACATLSPPPNIGCPDGAGVKAKLEAARANIESQYNQAQTRYADTAQKLTQHVNDASARLSDAASAFSTIQSHINTQYPEVCSGGASCCGFCGFFPSLSLPDTNLPGPTFDAALPALNVPPTDGIDNIGAGAAQAIQQFEDQLANAVDGANLDASALTQNLNGVSVEGFEDYNPPEIDPLKEKNDHAQRSAAFEQDAAVSLDAIEQAQQKGVNASYAPVFTSNVSASGLLQKAKNTNWFSYKDLQDAGFTVEWLLTPINLMASLFQILDIVWRLLQSINILRRFWGRSSLPISPVDVTTDKESKSRAQAVVVNPLRAMAMLATSPLVIAGVLFTFLFLAGGIAFSVYQPFYLSYNEGCVAKNADGVVTGDGTVLTRNAYAIAYNYASHTGNKLRLSGLEDYEQKRSDFCARYGEKSANDERRVQAQMELIVGSHVRTSADVQLMKKCYDTNFLDNDPTYGWTAHPVNDTSTGQPYPLLSVTLGEAACSVVLSNSSLEDGVYNCQELPECDIECNDLADEFGNDQSELYSYTRTAACTAQWWFHSNVLRMTFCITIWVFVNIWRSLFVSGMIRVCWNFLNTGFFTYIATCTSNGKHTYEEEVLAERVRGLLSKTRMFGFFMIVVACASQVPWIMGLYYFSTGLVYQKLAGGGSSGGDASAGSS